MEGSPCNMEEGGRRMDNDWKVGPAVVNCGLGAFVVRRKRPESDKTSWAGLVKAMENVGSEKYKRGMKVEKIHEGRKWCQQRWSSNE